MHRFKEYQELNIPEDKYWTWNTQDGIEMQFGYQNGRVDKGYSIMLGELLVNGLIVGSPGSGKSALSDFILGTLYLKYPPEELDIILVDFKKVEFYKYQDIGVIPHISAIHGIKDGEQLIPVLNELLTELKNRTALFKRYSAYNIIDYNKIARNNPEKLKSGDTICSRVLFYIEEITSLYSNSTLKQIHDAENLFKAIFNLARACGCHMIFQTQNFSNIMPKIILNQTRLRVCLRTSKEIALAVIGNELPSLITEVGNCYTNELSGLDTKTTKYWSFPLLGIEDMTEYIPKLVDWADKGTLDGKTHINRKSPYFTTC